MKQKPSCNRSIALLAQKGGVGKTTIAAGLAEWLASQHIACRLLDGNAGQQSLTRWSALREQAEIKPQLTVTPTFEVITEGGKPRLRDRTAELIKSPFAGVTILDLPGGIGDELGPALRYCDIVLLPLPPMAFDFLSLTEVGALIESARQVRKEDGRPPLQVHVVLNKRARIVAQERIKEQLLLETQALDIKVCSTELSNLADFYAAAMGGLSPIAFAPSGKAAQQLGQLAAELGLGR